MLKYYPFNNNNYNLFVKKFHKICSTVLLQHSKDKTTQIKYLLV